METGSRVLNPAVSLQETSSRALSQFKKPLEIGLALAIGLGVWNLPPPSSLDEKGMHFLATLAVGVTLWVLEAFDEYVVGLMLLLSWVTLGIANSKLALTGFSQSSWVFVVSALGIGAAVKRSGLLARLAGQLLGRIPMASHKTHTFALFAMGVLLTPLLPTGKARAVIASPLSQAVSKAKGFSDRSNGSVALALSALTGFSHMSFTFLTGAEFCLIGWNLLPPESKSAFGWTTWFLAALPAGLLISFIVFISIHILYPSRMEDRSETYNEAITLPLDLKGSFGMAEWIGLAVLTLTLIGWMTMPLHGIDEAWVALAGLLVFLMSGCLDKKSFKNDLDWGLILFFGIVNSMAAVSSHLHVERWITALLAPILIGHSVNPLSFLLMVTCIVCFARLFLRKAAAVVLLTVTFIPIGQSVGVHPGVLLLTILMASECFFLPYQDGPYQIAYSSTEGKAFSHRQARRVLTAKLIATLLAVAVSVPYWTMLGFIE